ncbi:MAG: extracellular solute-binding protein [Spirochaetales bacterium]|nr:extracellular solute-binding protein [Spirochaetales bacterium]
MGQPDTLAFRLGTLVFALVVLAICGFSLYRTNEPPGIDLAVSLQPAEIAGLEEVLKGFRSENPTIETRVQVFNENPPVAQVYLVGSSNTLQSLTKNIPKPNPSFSVFDELRKVLQKFPKPEDRLETLDILRSLVDRGYLNQAFLESYGESLGEKFLPILWAPYGLFVNRQVFENRGLAFPRTWEELETTTPLVRGTPNPIPLGIPGKRAIELARWLFDRQGIGVQVFDQWQNLGLIHPDSPTMSEEDAALLLQDGRIALVLGSLSLLYYLPVESAPNLVFRLLPPRENRSPMIPARIIGALVPDHGGETPGVQELLEFFSRPETQELWVGSVGPQIFLNPIHQEARFPNETGFGISALARNARVIRAE